MSARKKLRHGPVGIILGVAALLLIVAGLAAIPGMLLSGDSMCDNQPLSEAKSPGGAHRAVVFTRNCGATTGFSTQVSILPGGGELPNDGGNAFVADDDHGAAPAGPGGGPVVEAVWLGENRLRIRHHPRARVFHSETRVGDVEVVYDTKP